MLGRVKKAVSQVASARRTRERERLIAALRGSKRHLSINGDLIVSRPDLISIGDWVSFTGTVTLYGDGGIDIGNNVVFADSVLLLSRNHEYTAVDAVPYSTPYKLDGLTIGDDVAFGMRVIVCPGVKIGTHALIGAGAVVTSNVPDHAIMMGNPARPAGKRDAEAYAFTKAHGRPLGQIRSGRLFDRKSALASVRTALSAELDQAGVVFDGSSALDRFGEFRVAVLYEFAMTHPAALFCLTTRGYAVFDRGLVSCGLSRHAEDGHEVTPKSVRDTIGVNLSSKQLEELQDETAKTPHALETFLALGQ